jgi:hypothetical protein
MNADNHLTRSGSTDLKPVSPEEAMVLWTRAENKVIQPATAHGLTNLQPLGLCCITSTPQLVTRADLDWLILSQTS